MRVAFLIASLFAALVSTSAYPQSPRDIPLDEFAALRVNSGVRLSPNGENVLIITAFQGQRIVLVKPLKAGGDFEGVAIPPLKDMDIRWAEWKNDDYILISMSLEINRDATLGLQMETRLVSVPIHDIRKTKNMGIPPKNPSKSKVLTGNIGNIGGDPSLPRVQDRVVDMMPSDPNRFLLEIDEDASDRATEVRLVDISSGNYRLVYDPSNDGGGWVADLSGNIRFGYGGRYAGASLSDVKFSWYYLNPLTGQWVNYPEAAYGRQEDYSVAGFFDDPRFAYMIMKGEDGFEGLYKFDMIDLKAVETLYAPDGEDIDGVVTDPYTNRILGVGFEGAGSAYYYFDEEFRRLQTLVDKALPGASNHLVSWSRDRTKFIVASDSDIDSGSYYFFDVAKMRMDFIEAAYKGLDPRLMSPMTKTSYQARDGFTIPAYLTIPLGQQPKNLPTVVLPHGGPHSRDNFGYDWLVQFLASRGYVVLQPQFRGSTGQGKEFQEAGKRQWGQKMQDDVTDGAQWLIDQGIADPDRMCIFGWSYGGYAALTATIKTPDLFQCSISINGISDLVKLISEESNFLGGKQWGELIGNRREDRDMLEANSAYYHTGEIKVPILLIAAKDDTIVNYEQSTILYKRLQNASKPVEYVELKDGNHSVPLEPGRLAILQAIESFLARNIGN